MASRSLRWNFGGEESRVKPVVVSFCFNAQTTYGTTWALGTPTARYCFGGWRTRLGPLGAQVRRHILTGRGLRGHVVWWRWYLVLFSFYLCKSLESATTERVHWLYEDITLLRLMHLLLIQIHQTKTRPRHGYMPRGWWMERAERAPPVLYSAVCTVFLADLTPVVRPPVPEVCLCPCPCPCPRGSWRPFQVSCLVSGIRSLVRHGSVNRDLCSDRVLTKSLANLSTRLDFLSEPESIL